LSNLVDLAKILPDNVSAVFASVRDPNNADPNYIDVCAVDVLKLIDMLTNNGTLTKERRLELIASFNKIGDRQDSTSNEVSEPKLAQLRKDIVRIANEIKPGNGAELLQTIGRQQILQAKADMLRPENKGIKLGLDLGDISDVSQLITALGVVDAVCFNAQAGLNEKYFKEIDSARSKAVVEHKISKDCVFAISIPADMEQKEADAIAELAKRYNIEVRVAANTIDDLAKRANTISNSNAGVVVNDNAVAEEVKKTGKGSMLVAAFPNDGKKVTRMNIKSNNTDVITSILTMAKEVLVQTPEAQFNAGSHDGETMSEILLTHPEGSAVMLGNNTLRRHMQLLRGIIGGGNVEDEGFTAQVISGVRHGFINNAAEPVANCGRRCWYKVIEMAEGKNDRELAEMVYGFAYAVVRNALMSAVLPQYQKDGAWVQEHLAEGNVLVEGYIAGLTVDEMKDGRTATERVPSHDAADMRELMAGHTEQNVVDAVSIRFKRPFVLCDDNFAGREDFLALAAKIELGLLKAELNQPKVDLQQAGQENAELFAAVLRAG
jgi:hypothetical protein